MIAIESGPEVADGEWSEHPIDLHVLRRLESARLSPSREADKRTLIRRVTFDLTGLPPTRKEIRAFLADKSPGAYEALIDRNWTRFKRKWGLPADRPYGP